MDTNGAVGLPTYADAYAARYGDTIVNSERLGPSGASLIRFNCPAGRYRIGATSDFALTMVQSGGFAAEFDNGHGQFSVNVAPGQLFVSPPFSVTQNAFSAMATGVVVALGHARVAEFLSQVALKPETAFHALYTRVISDDFIRTALNQLLSVPRSRRRADALFAEAAILAIFAALARHGTERSARAKRGLVDWQLRRVMEKLESMQDVPVAELAASANLSPFYFARVFKQTTGLPPHHFHQRVRVERAKDLLTATRLSVTDIALRVGYGSSQALARVFRHNVGTTPAEYRRLNPSLTPRSVPKPTARCK